MKMFLSVRQICLKISTLPQLWRELGLAYRMRVPLKVIDRLLSEKVFLRFGVMAITVSGKFLKKAKF